MKRKILLFVCGILALQVSAQGKIEITPIVGFNVNGRVESFASTFKISDDISYGAMLTFNMDDYSAVELSYKRSDNTVREFYYPTATNYRFDIGIEHYQLGFQRVFRKGDLAPFAGVSLGTSRYFRKDNKNDIWAFSGSFGGGVKYFFSDRIGIRFHSNLIMPLEFGGGGFFCSVGTGGGGCGTAASFYVPTVHWENSLGLIFRM